MARPKHWTIGPRLRDIDNQAEPVVLRVFVDHGSHLLQNLLRDLVLLSYKVVLSIFLATRERLLLRFDLPNEASAVLIIRRLRRIELFLETVDLVCHRLDLVALGFELLAERFEFFLSFIRGQNRILNTDNTNPGRPGGSWSGCRPRGRRSGRSSIRRTTLGHGNYGHSNCHDHENSHNLAIHWIA